jgi:hypothetical protein
LTSQNLDSLFNVAQTTLASTVTHFSNQSMPDTGTLPVPDATIPGYVQDLGSVSGVTFAGNSRSRLFVSSLRETLRSADTTAQPLPGPNQPAYSGGLNPSYTFDAGMAVRSRPLPPPDNANQWQMIQVSNNIATALQLSTDPAAGAGLVTWIWLTRTFRLFELFSQVRLEGALPESNCQLQSQPGCSWVFDRSSAMYDKISNRFLILVRSINMAYPGVDPNNAGSDQTRLYLAISTTADVKGQYRLFRITPSSPAASPASCPGGQYPNIDTPVSQLPCGTMPSSCRQPACGGLQGSPTVLVLH